MSRMILPSCAPSSTEFQLLKRLLANRNCKLAFRDLLAAVQSDEKEVWESLCRLQEQGFVINCSPVVGISLEDPLPDILHPVELQILLERREFHIRWKPEIFQVIGSTNDEVIKQAKRGAKEGLVVVSDRQLKGRGRQGRSWESFLPLGLYMTALLRPKWPVANPQQLAILSSLSAAEALFQMGLKTVAIKWPNDIVVGAKKLGGILIEIDRDEGGNWFAAIGIGINLNQHTIHFSESLQAKATSFYLETGKKVRRVELLIEILSQLDRNSQRSFGAIKSLWEKRMVQWNEKVVFEANGQKMVGRMIGIDETGCLLIESESGSIQKIFSI
ncbi:biotin--acetyl-CoA-carboxylase ligase [Methylacidiphilum kamchatkense Kam1]|uniref:biotin--[biotin carboxyl-carrier protein] ligase n=1 Tax=Methylacidiphilum kamchatkense Kam1 TaxID=1202785 RepID=A0ABR4ZWN4_9BACT|nr:biotin--acetyl-CoA-carboxylase ligase [Methylacidiphilum kamchatkense Kam1]